MFNHEKVSKYYEHDGSVDLTFLPIFSSAEPTGLEIRLLTILKESAQKRLNRDKQIIEGHLILEFIKQIPKFLLSIGYWRYNLCSSEKFCS